VTDSERRPATDVDRLAEQYLDDYLTLDPVLATICGISGHDTELPDLSPDGHAELSALRRRMLSSLDGATPGDATDRVTVAAVRDRIEAAESIRAIGAEESALNNVESPVQKLRRVFDLMPTATVDDWATVAVRLSRVPTAIRGYIASLRFAAARGQVSARRQIEAGIVESSQNADPAGFFAALVETAAAKDLPKALRGDLDRGARAAAGAYRELATFLGEELRVQASDTDAVGRDAYAVFARSALGTSVDLEETYLWGQDELARVNDEQRSTAKQIRPGASLPEAMEHLDADPTRRLSGTEDLLAWMQRTSDVAIATLADTQFDIPAPIRALECLIAPTPGGIYYTGPSEDFTRPGRMWWGVAPGVTEFVTWRELSTVYHEGVPGHHLQMAQTAYRKELLNRWRRSEAAWVDGHGEGWALYAEALMAELGFLDDPGDYLGLLASQSFRAARVVIDIGFHCGFPAPAEVGGGAWTYDKAWQLLSAHSVKDEPSLRFELDRYLGWPGQAPSYKIGERWWLQLRDDVRAREGDAFDLKAFHRRALDIGSVGLDVLRSAVLDEFGD